jgi:AraC-like DNA-binding protein
MQNHCIQFEKIDRDEDFARFAREINGQATTDHVIQLSGPVAKGLIRKFHLDVGLHMRTWDLVVNTPVALHKKALPVLVNNSSFSIFYIMTPEGLVLNNIGQHHTFNTIENRCALFISDDLSVDAAMQPHQPIQFIDFSISTYWLLQQLKNTDSLPDSLYHAIIEARSPQILFEVCATQVNLAVNRLFINAMQKNKEEASFNTLSALLVTDLLYRLCRTEPKCTTNKSDVYYDKIVAVEAIIMEHLQKDLPTLPDIAHRVSLSESTLKRYFKSIFGRSIYEYYLEKKMMLAKRMLLDKPLSVNEAAEMMGYEKVSNFIDIFKKHHGHSPGSMKKRGFC